MKQDANVKLVDLNLLGNQYTFRFNTLHKPFDNAKVRQAVFYALNQEDFLKAVIGDPTYYKICKSFYPSLNWLFESAIAVYCAAGAGEEFCFPESAKNSLIRFG